MIQIPVWHKDPWFYTEYDIYLINRQVPHEADKFTGWAEIHPFQLSHSGWKGERPWNDIEIPGGYPDTPLQFKWIRELRWPQVIIDYLVLLVPLLTPAIIMKIHPWVKLKKGRQVLTSIVLMFSLITLVYGLVSLASGMTIFDYVKYPNFRINLVSPHTPVVLYSLGSLLAMVAGGIGIKSTWWKVRKENRIPKTVILPLIFTVLLSLTITIPIPWIKLQQGLYQHPLMVLGKLSLWEPAMISSWAAKGLLPQVIATLFVGLEPILSMIVIGIASLVIRFKRKNLSSIAFLTPLLSCVMGVLSLIVFAEVASLVLTSVLTSWPTDPWEHRPRPIPWQLVPWMFISSFLGPSVVFLTSGICSIVFGGLVLKELWKSKKITSTT